jgi:hypothetical protein
VTTVTPDTSLRHSATVDIPAHLHSFWKEFAATRATDPTPHFLEAFYFDDNEASASKQFDADSNAAIKTQPRRAPIADSPLAV